MFSFVKRTMLLAGVAGISLVGVASASAAPGSCQNDSKLLPGNPIFLNSWSDTPTEDQGDLGTWWGITEAGLVDAGFDTVAEQKELTEKVLGTSFSTFEAAVVAVIDNVVLLDKNANDYVCATSLSGTRAFLAKKVGLVGYNSYFFTVSDDNKGA